MKFLSLVGVLLLLSAGSTGQSCAIWNQGAPGGNTLVDYSNTNYHINGLHWGDAWETGACSYQNTSNRVGSPCIGSIKVYDTMTPGEQGDVVGNEHHVYATNDSGASQTREYPQGTSAIAQSAIGVVACPIQLCNVSVSLAGIITVSPNTAIQLWHATDSFDTYCDAETMGCPIIIDTAGEGFQLTDAADGVVTDMVIPGRPMRFAWTKAGSHNAFLWLDNHLFGNSTPQPPSDDPNGFAALAVYDSNHDGKIDASDPVFSQLRLWIDSNHDGVAQPQELFTLPSLGVYSISLEHKVDKYRDANGNLYHYRGHLQKTTDADRTIYDVYLATDTHAPAVLKNTLQ